MAGGIEIAAERRTLSRKYAANRVYASAKTRPGGNAGMAGVA
jgi:hypothetical protein